MVNWKLRFRNKPVLVALIGWVVTVAYQILGIVGFVPTITESELLNSLMLGIEFFVALGIVVDPTTVGVADSQRALDRSVPGDNVNTAADASDISDVLTTAKHLRSDSDETEQKG